jgi:hypothetical protein
VDRQLDPGLDGGGRTEQTWKELAVPFLVRIQRVFDFFICLIQVFVGDQVPDDYGAVALQEIEYVINGGAGGEILQAGGIISGDMHFDTVQRMMMIWLETVRALTWPGTYRYTSP